MGGRDRKETMSLQPIEIIFYNDDDEVVTTHTRNRIPAYILDMAITLGESLKSLSQVEDTSSAAEKTAPLFDFIVELFGGKFTRDELKRQADLVDCMSVYRSVLARANSLAIEMAHGNPQPPSSKKR